MAEKLGNGGNGLENYDPNTGKYINETQQKLIEFSKSIAKQKVIAAGYENIAPMVWANVSDDYKNDLKKLHIDEKRELLENSQSGLNPAIYHYADEEVLDTILAAEHYLNAEANLNAEISAYEAQISASYEELKHEIDEKYVAYKFAGIWKYKTVSPSDYSILKASGSFKEKVEYYVNVISTSTNEEEIQKAKQHLSELTELEELGKKYNEEISEVDLKAAEKNSDLYKKLSQLQKRKQLFQENIQLKADLANFIVGCQAKNAPYSDFRKNNAIWITEEWAKKNYNTSNVSKASIKFFGSQWENKWNGLTSVEQNELNSYTGSGYSRFNRPLRGLFHSGWSGWDFATHVAFLTSAIDKCSWDNDIWVQRGISEDAKFLEINGIKKAITDLSDTELQSLVGQTFIDKGFYSSGAGKGTGFDSSHLILNTYCPKGTKMAYMNTKGAYANSDENEMILQRGYSYRITKVEKKGYKYYIDCEVILGSEKQNNEYDEKELKKIGKTYLG